LFISMSMPPSRDHAWSRPPRPDHPAAEPSQKKITRQPVLGGLINEYEPAA